MAALTVVESLGPPSLEERCARHLARLRTAATPAEVAAVLSLTGLVVSVADVSDAMAEHPAWDRHTPALRVTAWKGSLLRTPTLTVASGRFR